MKKKSGKRRYGWCQTDRDNIDLIKYKNRIRANGKQKGPWAIATELNDEGIPPPTHDKLWNGQTVKNIIEREKKGEQKRKTYPKKTALSAEDYMNEAELAKVFAVCPERDRFMLRVLLACGLRATAFCELQIQDIAVYDGRHEINVRSGKGEVQRVVNIPVELAEELRDYVGKAGKFIRETPIGGEPLFLNSLGGPMKYSCLYKRLVRLAEKAGVGKLNPHRWRHTFGTLLYAYRKDIVNVQKQMGHKDIRTTQIYTGTRDKDKDEQTEGLWKQVSKAIGSEKTRKLNHSL